MRKFAAKGIHLFYPILAGANLRDRAIACLGALVGIALTVLLCTSLPLDTAAYPLLFGPVGASAVLVFAVPASPMAQPWSVIGGNMISALVGVAAAHSIGNPELAAGVAVAGAILAMSLLHCLHPPGGAVALTAVIGSPAILAMGYDFALAPVGLNSVMLLTAGWLFHRFSGHSYPHRPVLAVGAETIRPGLHHDDIRRALADMGETFDVDPDDLDLLLQRAEQHAIDRGAIISSGPTEP